MDNGAERAKTRRSVKRHAVFHALLKSKSHPSAEHIIQYA
jgi:Fe2+ or Zn2+ uptake regulation protein